MRLFGKAVATAVLIAMSVACNEEESGPTIQLSVTEISDSKRLLDWNELENAEGYTIWRSVKRNGVLEEPAMLTSVSFLTLSYVDEGLPLAQEVQYYVMATVNNREVRSNTVSSTGASYLPIIPYQLKLLPDENLAVIRDYNSIFLVDYENLEIVGQREFNGKLGAFDFGMFNGKKEMYLPCSDHSVYILDPYELTMIDTLNADYPVESVAVNSKGTIYYSCSDPQTPLKLYDRSTMGFINEYDGESDSGILLQSDNRLLAVSSHISPATMSFYTFDDDGNLISRSDDPYFYDYEMDKDRLKMSSKFIVTSTEGFVYTADDNLTWVTTLTQAGSEQVDFEFSDDGGTIYVATSGQKRIFTQTVGGQSSSITTKGYPWAIARNGNEMIVISSPTAFSPYNITNIVIVERVDLN
jgi:hypothetical protein